MAIKLADTTRPNNYVDSEHLGTFPVAYAEDIWFEDGTRLSDLELEGGSIQKTELPFASSTEEGKIYQYIGATGTYTNGYFYKCVEQTPTGFGRYEWQELKFVENPVVYSETVPAIQDYETGNVVLYTGTDTPVYFKGHSYRLIKQIISGRWFKINGDNYFAIGNSIAEGDYLFEFSDASSYVVPTYIVTSVSGDTVTAQSVSDASTTISGEITNPTATAQSIAYWEDIGGGGGSGQDAPKVFNGTKDDWDLLSTEQKKEYDYANFTDDSNEGEGAIVGFYGISGDLLSETHQCDGEEVEYTYTVPEDGYYAVTYDMSATIQTTQYCVAKMRGGNGILYTYDITVSAPYRILTRKILPYLKTGSTIAIAHGGSYGQATVKINRIIYN